MIWLNDFTLENTYIVYTVKTLLQAAASIRLDEIFGQFYLAKFESYLVVRLLITSLRYFEGKYY